MLLMAPKRDYFKKLFFMIFFLLLQLTNISKPDFSLVLNLIAQETKLITLNGTNFHIILKTFLNF